jgi:2-polyprenyl-3-methyl-5-hydroxy-6-metoxy-1,4-benzoquinol methylase
VQASLTAPAELVAADPPQIAVEEVARCPVCGHDRFTEEATGFDYELLTCANAWRYVRCALCGHIWLNPRPAVSELGVIYPSSYYAYNYEEEINTIAVKGKDALDRLKFRSLVRALPRPPKSYLDIGCGNGRFLRLMTDRGVPRSACYGIELDERVVSRLSSEGFQAFCTRVEDCDQIPPGAIDLVTAFHVIEHVEDPASMVRQVASWIAPGGMCAIETPNTDSVDQRLFARGWWGGYHIPRHWNLFTPSTLERLLRDAGLEVVQTRFQTGHSFWMFSLHHKLRYAKRPHRRLARMFDPFKGLPLLVAFTALDKLRAAAGFRTSAMLVLARKAS